MVEAAESADVRARCIPDETKGSMNAKPEDLVNHRIRAIKVEILTPSENRSQHSGGRIKSDADLTILSSLFTKVPVAPMSL
jgi:hypothetical protein